MAIGEQTILDALHQVPMERWGEVLRLLESLKGTAPATGTAADLARSDLVGMWADRDDIGDSRAFARRLRQQAETRGRATDVAGH
jgi:hypothetical protein